MVWFVVGTLLGVFFATVWNSNLRFVTHRFWADPLRYAVLYLVATLVSTSVGLLTTRIARPLNRPLLDIALRVGGGFVLGFMPYIIGSLFSQIFPNAGAVLATMHPAFLVPMNVAIGAMVSLSMESAVRFSIRTIIERRPTQVT
jgi:hypothetical protein